jgi:hypothetical protein
LRYEYFKPATEKALILLDRLGQLDDIKLVSENNGYIFKYKGESLFFKQEGRQMSFGVCGHPCQFVIPEEKRSLFYKIIWTEEVLDNILKE